MKKEVKNQLVKLSEKFDKQLLTILSEELKALKEAKTQIIKSFTDDGLLVA